MSRTTPSLRLVLFAAVIGYVLHPTSAKVAPAAARPVLSLPAQVSADFNRDGRPDRVMVRPEPSVSLAVQITGRPGVLVIPQEGYVAQIAASDYDRDGDIDLVVLTETSQLSFWVNDGLGHFAALARRTHPLPSQNAASLTGSAGSDAVWALPRRVHPPILSTLNREPLFLGRILRLPRGPSRPISISSASQPSRAPPGSPRFLSYIS